MKLHPRAVVFDVGNVLYDWRPVRIYERLIPDSAARAALLRDVVTIGWHEQHDAGRPFAETSAELIARFPDHEPAIRAWRDQFGESLSPMPGMAELVAELDSRGVPLYAITNFSAEFWCPFRAREAALFDRFRGIIVSGEERLMKPDPAIYALALERFGLEQGEGLFVDDRAENVAAAEAAGFVGHVFGGEGNLRARLHAENLL